MVSIFIHRNGRTERATSLDRAWLNPASGTFMWVDLASPSIPESPQRDVIARLPRREFVDISSAMSFRFRDVYDHLVRLSDDATIFQDRKTPAQASRTRLRSVLVALRPDDRDRGVDARSVPAEAVDLA
ncbi:MAG: hypothetical protein DMF89_16800 [Acidobacteria bacterium]|nr:MAG: hypothetical protein DMF89_16800 [Acidobacteriota bacterium]